MDPASFTNIHVRFPLKDFQTLYLKARKKTLLTEQGSIHITRCWYTVLAPKTLKEGKHVTQRYISSALSLWFSKPCIFHSTATGCHVFVFLRYLLIPFSQLNQSDLCVRVRYLMDSEVTQQWLCSSPHTFVLDSTKDSWRKWDYCFSPSPPNLPLIKSAPAFSLAA